MVGQSRRREKRRFEVTNKGHCMERATRLSMDEIIAVDVGEEADGKPSLVINTLAKGGKSYVLAARCRRSR